VPSAEAVCGTGFNADHGWAHCCPQHGVYDFFGQGSYSVSLDGFGRLQLNLYGNTGEIDGFPPGWNPFDAYPWICRPRPDGLVSVFQSGALLVLRGRSIVKGWLGSITPTGGLDACGVDWFGLHWVAYAGRVYLINDPLNRAPYMLTTWVQWAYAWYANTALIGPTIALYGWDLPNFTEVEATTYTMLLQADGLLKLVYGDQAWLLSYNGPEVTAA